MGRLSTPKYVTLFLMVCSPFAFFWALNLSSAANIKTQSVTLRMYITKLVCLLLENSVQFASESKLHEAGRRTKYITFSAIFGLSIAVLTTISQIDSRADGECDWQAARTNSPCRISGMIISGSGEWQEATRFSWCCAMVRDGDFLNRPPILSSAAMACAAALWGWLAAAMSAGPAVTFAGSGGLAVGSAALLGWGARGDDDGEWLLFVPVWLATLSTPAALLASPLPFWYDGVAVTAGVVGSTSHLRRAMAVAAALAEAAVLPAVRGGAILAMVAAMAARIALALGLAAAAACLAPRARAAAARVAASPARRARAAARAARAGLVTRDGRIAAGDVFEFDAAGPHARWWWVCKGGVRRGRFAVLPLPEYRRLGLAAPLGPGRPRPPDPLPAAARAGPDYPAGADAGMVGVACVLRGGDSEVGDDLGVGDSEVGDDLGVGDSEVGDGRPVTYSST